MRLNGETSGAIFPKGDLRECLYIVNFDTTIETDTFLWRSLPYMELMSRSQERGCWQLIIKGDWS